jgi:hypothetical protein
MEMRKGLDNEKKEVFFGSLWTKGLKIPINNELR